VEDFDMAFLSLALTPLIGYWYWGWWWWWWIAIVVIFLWLLFLPPFSYGPRWYGGYGMRNIPPTGTAPGVPPMGAADSMQWQSVENQYAESPSAAVLEADRLVTPLVSGTSEPAVADQYRHAHAVAERAQRGEATEPEINAAMNEYRTIFHTLRAHGA
jgi:hypothetical protein